MQRIFKCMEIYLWCAYVASHAGQVGETGASSMASRVICISFRSANRGECFRIALTTALTGQRNAFTTISR